MGFSSHHLPQFGVCCPTPRSSASIFPFIHSCPRQAPILTPRSPDFRLATPPAGLSITRSPSPLLSPFSPHLSSIPSSLLSPSPVPPFFPRAFPPSFSTRALVCVCVCVCVCVWQAARRSNTRSFWRPCRSRTRPAPPRPNARAAHTLASDFPARADAPACVFPGGAIVTPTRRLHTRNA